MPTGFDTEKYVFFCQCGCGNGFAIKADTVENKVSISTVVAGFNIRQNTLLKATIRRRLSICWNILRGREYLLHDIWLEAYEWDRFMRLMKRTDKTVQNIRRGKRRGY